MTDRRDIHADRCSGLGDEHQVVFVRHTFDTNQVAGLLGDLDGLNTLAAAVRDTIDRLAVLVIQRGSLAETVL